ncbi:MAG: 30S ribosomal protein S20 [Deltaproteobacteria bacterium]
MPNIKSAIKRVKITETKTLQNAIVKTGLKTQLKKFDEAVKEKDTKKAADMLVSATKSIDKAVAKGVLHKNTASRKKSAIAKKLNQVK